MQVIHYLDIFGTVVFAITGVLQAHRKHMDGFGVLVLAGVTAVGGGTMRDLVLGLQPVFWVRQAQYLYVILGSSLLCMLALRYSAVRISSRLLQAADAIGLATFTVIGVEKALGMDVPAAVAITMGVLTGVGGGVIRDVLTGEVPMVLRAEIYATACILGGLGYILALYAGVADTMAAIIAAAITLVIRLAAIRWKWRLPVLNHPA